MYVLPLMLAVVTAAAPHFTPDQATGIARDFCQKMGAPVTAAPRVEYDPAGRQTYSYWLPCWKVTFPGQSEVAIVDQSGAVCSYSNDALFHHTGEIPAGTPIPEQQAVEIARKTLEAAQAPMDELLFSRSTLMHPHVIQDMITASGHYYLVSWNRVDNNGVSYQRQGAVVFVQSETGDVLSLDLAFPTEPLPATQLKVDALTAGAFAARHLATTELGNSPYMQDAVLKSMELKSVQPTTFWQNQDRRAHDKTARLAWDCWFQGNPMFARVWVDAETGAIIGGDSGGPGGIGPSAGGFFIPALAKAKEAKIYGRDSKLNWQQQPEAEFSGDSNSNAAAGKLFAILSKAKPLKGVSGITIPAWKVILKAERVEPYEMLYVPEKKLIGQPGDWYQLPESLEAAAGLPAKQSAAAPPAGKAPGGVPGTNARLGGTPSH